MRAHSGRAFVHLHWRCQTNEKPHINERSRAGSATLSKLTTLQLGELVQLFVSQANEWPTEHLFATAISASLAIRRCCFFLRQGFDLLNERALICWTIKLQRAKQKNQHIGAARWYMILWRFPSKESRADFLIAFEVIKLFPSISLEHRPNYNVLHDRA